LLRSKLPQAGHDLFSVIRQNDLHMHLTHSYPPNVIVDSIWRKHNRGGAAELL
jgi:hypothetical protein